MDYLRVLGRRKLLFLVIVLLVPATAVAASLRQTPTYQASAEVLLTTRDLEAILSGATQTYIDPARVAQTRAELARVPAVVDRVLEKVPSAGLDRQEFLESSTVSAALGSDILTFSAKNSDPRLAMQLATEYANSYTEYQQQLETEAVRHRLRGVRQQLADLQANGDSGSPSYQALQRREDFLATMAAAPSPSAQVVRNADEAPKVGPRTVRNGLIALCLGLVLALVVVFLIDALDTRVRSVDAIREALGLRLLGRLSTPPSRLRKRNGLVMLADPTSPDADQFRALRWSLDVANAEHGARTIMITSAIGGEGKSTTVANLAVALARAGRRVVLIDADFSDPHLHRLFDLEQRPGLTDVELGETGLVEALRPIGLTEDFSGTDDSSRRVEHTGSLEVLPGGSTLQDPDELGFDRALGRIIPPLLRRADIVLVDAPPLLRGHAIALSAHVDAVVVVVRLKALRTSALRDLSWVLEGAPVPKLGFILTEVEKSEDYRARQRYGSERRQTVRLRPTLTVAPSPADSAGDGRGRRRAETQAGVRPDEATGPSENDGRSDEPAPGALAQARLKSSGRRSAETQAAVRPDEATGPSENDGHSDKPAPGAPAGARSKSGPPSGGLSPREKAMRSTQSRRAKSAKSAKAAPRTEAEEGQDTAEGT